MAATRIDCDIHRRVGGTRTTLLPYLDDHWKSRSSAAPLMASISTPIRRTCRCLRPPPTGGRPTASQAPN